ncbi:hypothetical protein ACFPYI_06430 [Halomarina salina]|uniref:Uncharacterized protein n=1 Tax=Halomarina salina TaxID=1872699 RepID=A0ABD5RKQ4_9EURY|nr:hypothetical protein [Halomarina salina]
MNRVDGGANRDASTYDPVELQYTATVRDGSGLVIVDLNDLRAWIRSTTSADLSEML